MAVETEALEDRDHKTVLAVLADTLVMAASGVRRVAPEAPEAAAAAADREVVITQPPLAVVV
jgi:hypothetical protein